MGLAHRGCPGNRHSVVHFLCRFLGHGQRARKWAAVEKMSFYVEHITPEYIVSNGSLWTAVPTPTQNLILAQ